MGTFKRLLLLVSCFLILAILTPAWTKGRVPMDGSQVPIVVTPSDLVMDPGSSVNVTVTLSGTTTTNQVVDIASNSPAVSVPSQVTVLAGHSTASFTATAAVIPGQQDPIVAKITADCNYVSAEGEVVVNYAQ